MNAQALISAIENGQADAMLTRLYGEEQLNNQKTRYIKAIHAFADLFGKDRDAQIFSVAGRSELSGNHTDHNHGCVIAASVDLDIIAVAAKRQDNTVCVKSEGFPMDTVDLDTYQTPDPAQFTSSASIIAGMGRAFADKGWKTGGFDAYTTSSVLKGSGLSSSAAFEDMIGNIFSHLYNEGAVDNVDIAKMAQFAENVFFGKPCGLMDQMACAVGGIIAIDFADTTAPVITKENFDITEKGYNLCIVNTGGNHADLGEDYASVPAEMKAVAAHFGKSVLREINEQDVIDAIPVLRTKVGDRAILRALHFYAENKRVAEQKAALERDDLDGFFAGVLASGRSSFCYLQNVYTTKNLTEQGLSLALCLADHQLAGKRAAWRVHGGGFAGTIQAFVPTGDVPAFRKAMDAAFGEGACIVLRIRRDGAVKVI